MSQLMCEICGCTTPGCLARTKNGNHVFCNGKRGLSYSHIMCYLRNTKQNEIEIIPNDGKSYGLLKCGFCKKCTNVYSLGYIVKLNDKDKIPQIICRDCIEDNKAAKQGMDIESFIPIVQNNSIDRQILNIPAEQDMRSLTKNEINDIMEAIWKKDHKDAEFRPKLPPLMQTKDSYASINEFVDIMSPIIEAEMKDTAKLKSQEKCTCKIISPPKKRKLPNNWAAIEVSRYFLKYCKQFTKALLSKERIFATVTIQEKIPPNMLFIKFETRNSTLISCQDEMSIVTKSISTTFHRQQEALSALQSRKRPRKINPFLRDILLGRIKCTEKNNKFRQYEIKNLQETTYGNLNESQRDALKYAITHKFTMIQGPPGTGKTEVIARLAQAFQELGCHKTKILIATNSNDAADEATLRIDANHVDVVRVTSIMRQPLDNEVARLTSHRISKVKHDNDISALRSTRKIRDLRKADKLETNVIRQFNIVVSTTSNCYSLRIKNCSPFDVLIVDEASTSRDTDLLIPMTLSPKQMIIVGDQKQLGPVVLSKRVEACNYGRTLMDRLPQMCFLDMQYRMHPSISEFPSQEFYDKRIKDGVSAKDRTIEEFVPWPNPDVHILFWNVKSIEEIDDNGKSFLNRKQAYCAHEIALCAKSRNIDTNQIAFITPYLGQYHFLNKKLNDEFKITTINGIQGQESEYVVLSTVRGNNENELGFMSDPRRCNVALTRARRGLIILANADTLSCCKMWCDFMEICVKNGVFMEGEVLSNLKPSNFTPHIKNDNQPIVMKDEDLAKEK